MKFIKLLQTSGLVRKKVLVHRKGGKPFWSTRWIQEGQDVKEVVQDLGFEVIEEEKVVEEKYKVPEIIEEKQPEIANYINIKTKEINDLNEKLSQLLKTIPLKNGKMSFKDEMKVDDIKRQITDGINNRKTMQEKILLFIEEKEKVVDEPKKRESTGRVHLQGWMDSPSIVASEVRIGDVRLFNNGEDTIIGIEQKTPKTLTFTYEEKDREGKNYTQNVRNTTKIVIKELYDEEIVKDREERKQREEDKKKKVVIKPEPVITITEPEPVVTIKRSLNGASTNYDESVKNMDNYLNELNKNDKGKKLLESMEDYTIDSFVSINEYMKHGESETFKKTLPEGKIRGQKKYNVKNIKDSISNIKKFINDAPKFEGEVYRGFQYRTNNPESEMRWNNFIKSVEGLKEMKFGSFLSTSKDRVVATQFARRHSHASMRNCLIIIKTKSGAPIKKISLVESEQEILINDDKTYNIIKFEKQDEKNYLLHLEEK